MNLATRLRYILALNAIALAASWCASQAADDASLTLALYLPGGVLGSLLANMLLGDDHDGRRVS